MSIIVCYEIWLEFIFYEIQSEFKIFKGCNCEILRYVKTNPWIRGLASTKMDVVCLRMNWLKIAVCSLCSAGLYLSVWKRLRDWHVETLNTAVTSLQKDITAQYQRQKISNYQLISNPHASLYELCSSSERNSYHKITQKFRPFQ